jgi:hypothetical protein
MELLLGSPISRKMRTICWSENGMCQRLFSSLQHSGINSLCLSITPTIFFFSSGSVCATSLGEAHTCQLVGVSDLNFWSAARMGAIFLHHSRNGMMQSTFPPLCCGQCIGKHKASPTDQLHFGEWNCVTVPKPHA